MSVALSGDTAIVVAFSEDTGANQAGAAYIFTRSGNSWTQKQKIQANDKAADDRFGVQVAMGDDIFIIGSFGATDIGAIYITDCSEVAILEASTDGGTSWSSEDANIDPDIEVRLRWYGTNANSCTATGSGFNLSLIHISEPTRPY